MYENICLNEDEDIWSEIRRNWRKWPELVYDRLIIHLGTSTIQLNMNQFKKLKRSVIVAQKEKRK